MLQNKTVLLGVSGGIAAYKVPNLCSLLVKKGAKVETILTKAGSQFVSPLPFEALSGHKCHTDLFDPSYPTKTEHISLASRADLLVIAPASADIIAKLRWGMADDMLTTTALACTCPKLLVPAMNTAMYLNPATQDNLKILEDRGFEIMQPASGHLACGTDGIGRMPEPSEIFDKIEAMITMEKDLCGRRILVTAGPTQEPIDPVRYITNHSSGKMGYALAHAAMLRGAEVTLISGPCVLTPPPYVKYIPVVTAQEMYDAVAKAFPESDAVFKAAAVADYTPSVFSPEKVKKKDGDLSIPLRRTQDILASMKEIRQPQQFLCGFSMETSNLVENSRKKLIAKGLNMIACNNVKVKGAGFQSDTNVLTLITADNITELPIMGKEEAAHAILTRYLAWLNEGGRNDTTRDES